MPEIVNQIFHVQVSGTTYHVEVQEAVQYNVSLTSAGSLGLVQSVFGRVGDIVAETGDYEPSQLAQQGATDGQVLTWSTVLGSWVPGTVGGGAVDSVNGQTGAVVLDSDDIDEGLTNLYFTEARANAASAVVANTSARHTHANKAELDLVTDGDHDVRTDNPHGVTAAQVGAADASHTHAVGDLTQSGAVSGDLLYWDGANWAPLTPDFAPTSHVHTASDVTDFDTEVGNQADVTANTAARHTHTNKAELDLVTDGDHDVRTDNPHGVTVADLTDVVITSPADNDVLSYDNTSGDWINQTAAEAGLATASHVHAAADVTSGTFADARIAESSITQHESAITHQNVSGAGTNTHAQIDAHLALTDEHIDWTNATADLATTGLILSTFDGLSSGSAFFADLDVTASGNYTNVVNGFDLDYDLDMASSSIVTGTVRGVRFRYSAVDNGALYASPVVQIIDGRIDAGGVQVANATGSNPMYYKFENPAASQQFPNGFMRVDVAGGSATGTTIAFFSSCAVSGSQDGVGYRGYATGSGAATGTLVGTQGYVLLGASANQNDVAALDGRIVGAGATPADKIMGLRCVYHALVRQGSLVVTSANVETPNAVSSTHLDFLNDQGDAYVEGNIEVDGELYCDGNVAHSLVDVSTASVAAGDETYIIGDASSTSIVVDLPAVSGLSGHREYCIKKTDGSGNTVTVSAAGGDTIDGSGSVVLSSQYDHVRVVAGNGTDWHVVG